MEFAEKEHTEALLSATRELRAASLQLDDMLGAVGTTSLLGQLVSDYASLTGLSTVCDKSGDKHEFTFREGGTHHTFFRCPCGARAVYNHLPKGYTRKLAVLEILEIEAYGLVTY